jgi:hypothetical protein
MNAETWDAHSARRSRVRRTPAGTRPDNHTSLVDILEDQATTRLPTRLQLESPRLKWSPVEAGDLDHKKSTARTRRYGRFQH